MMFGAVNMLVLIFILFVPINCFDKIPWSSLKNSFVISNAADRIAYLPGLWPVPKFEQFSGYLDGATANIKLHYWLVESTNDPKTDPLILWLNGGPGCSSLEGILAENGPFMLKDGPELTYNNYSWNSVANVLYLEAPAGVGFSYAVDGNVTTDDDFTSLNMYHAVLNFLEKFPEYKNREFYITGESYGGVYVPLLALRVLNNVNSLNLKAIAVGNGLTSYQLNDNSLLYFLNYHGLVDEQTWDKLVSECCESANKTKCMFSDNQSAQCQHLVAHVMEAIVGLNIYNLYAPCYGGAEAASYSGYSVNHNDGSIVHSDFGNLFRENPHFKQQRSLRHLMANERVRLVIPCVNDAAIRTYLNTAEVKQALHVDLPNLPEWDVCSEQVNRDYKRTYKNLQEQYLDILRKKVPIFIYNGDIDMACNFYGDEWFVDGLGLTVKESLNAWLFIAEDGTKQIGGFKKVLLHDTTPLVFMTIRGAGHMVPYDKPAQALNMLKLMLKH